MQRIRIITCALVLLSVVFGVCGDLSGNFPSLATFPYKSPNLVETADIALTSFRVSGGPSLNKGQTLPSDAPFPASLEGTIAISTTPHGGGPILVAGPPYPDPFGPASAFDVNFNVIIPNSQDSKSGCVPDGGALSDFTDEGFPLAGSVLMVERGGGCNFQAKVDAATPKGVAALIIFNCLTCSSLGMVRIQADSSIPVFFMQMEDGLFLRNYLLGRRAVLNGTQATDPAYIPAINYTLPITGTLIGTGPIVPAEMTALQTIAGTLRIDPNVLPDVSLLRDWAETISDPTKDPCMDRLVGLWCERGRVKVVYLKYLALTGTFDAAFGAFTEMTDLGLAINRPDSVGLTGPVPDSVCGLRLLTSFSIENNRLTSMPECLGSAQPHLVYIQTDDNLINNIPMGLTNATNLVYLTMLSNQVASLPSSLSALTNLAKLDLSSNPFTSFGQLSFKKGFPQMQQFLMSNCQLNSNVPADLFAGAPAINIVDLTGNALTGTLSANLFSTATQLATLMLSHNAFSGPLPSTVFDGMSSMESIQLNVNSFTGTIPSFSGCTSLTSLDLSNNQFTGGLPKAWINAALPIVTVTLSYNQLNFNATDDVLNQMVHLDAAYLDHNQLVVDYRDEGDVGKMMYRLVGPIMTTLNVQNNNLIGKWGFGFASGFAKIQNFNLSTNQIQTLADDFFLMTGLVHLDLSDNALSGNLPDDIHSVTKFSSLYLQGNPNLMLPSWVQPADSGVYTSTEAKLYECLEFYSPIYRSLAIKADPDSLGFRSCRCKQGAYGVLPNCVPVPISVTMTGPSGVFTNRTRPFAPAITDDIYLPQPLGMSTSWVIDLQSYRRNDATGLESGNFSSVSSNLIPDSASLQPVRILFIRLHISRQHFSTASDSISVINSDSQSFFKITGEEAVNLPPQGSWSGLPANVILPDPTSVEYLTFYNDSLSNLDNPVLVEFRVPSNRATVQFISAQSGLRPHFVGTYAWVYDCVDRLELLDADLGNQCLATIANNYVPGRNGSYDYECLALSNLVSPILQSLTNPGDINYRGCRCSTGTFGLPPHCDGVPLNATLSAHAVPVAEVKYSLQVMTTPDVLDLPSTTNVSLEHYPASFTDEWYGGQRLTRGLSTGWTVDLRTLRRVAGNDTDLTDFPALDATAIDGSQPFQPVRIIDMLLHISSVYFTGPGNTLSVYDGNASFTGERLFVVSGADLTSRCNSPTDMASVDPTIPLALANRPEYQARYAVALSTLEQPYVCHVRIQSSQSSISFSSRDSDGKHFVSTYSYDFQCPALTELDSNNQCNPPSSNKKSALVTIIAVCSVLLFLSFAWVVRERYVRQRAQQRKARLSSSKLGDAENGGDDELMQPDDMKKNIHQGRVNELKKEMLAHGLSLTSELTLVILNWVNVGFLVSSSQALIDSYLSVTYVAIAVVSFMGFCVNSMARILTLRVLVLELKDLETAHMNDLAGHGAAVSTPTDDALLLSRVQRRVVQLQIISIAVLFDGLPMLVLNILRLLSENNSQSSSATVLRYLLQCVLGAVLIGIKIDRLLGIAELKKQIMELRLKIFDAKFSDRSRHNTRGGRATIGTRGNSVANDHRMRASNSVVAAPEAVTPAFQPDPLTDARFETNPDQTAVEVELTDRANLQEENQVPSDSQAL